MEALSTVKASTDIIQRCILRANDIIATSDIPDGPRAELKVNLYKIQREFTNVLVVMPHVNLSHQPRVTPEAYSPQPVSSRRTTPDSIQFSGPLAAPGSCAHSSTPIPQTPVSSLSTSSNDGDPVNTTAIHRPPGSPVDTEGTQSPWGNSYSSPSDQEANAAEPTLDQITAPTVITNHSRDAPPGEDDRQQTVNTSGESSTTAHEPMDTVENSPGTPLSDEKQRAPENTPKQPEPQTVGPSTDVPDRTSTASESANQQALVNPEQQHACRKVVFGEDNLPTQPLPVAYDPVVEDFPPLPSATPPSAATTVKSTDNENAPSPNTTDLPGPVKPTASAKPATARKRDSPNTATTSESYAATVFKQNTDLIVGSILSAESVAKAIETVNISRNSSSLEIETATSSLGGDISPVNSTSDSRDDIHEPNPKRCRANESISSHDQGLQYHEIDGVNHVLIKPTSVLSMNYDREQFLRGITLHNAATAICYFTTTGIAETTKDKTISREASWLLMAPEASACLARAKTIGMMDDQQKRDLLIPAVCSMIQERRNEPDFEASFDALCKVPNIKTIKIFHQGENGILDTANPQSGLNIVGEGYTAYITHQAMPLPRFFKTTPEFRGKHLLITGSQGRNIVAQDDPSNVVIMYKKGLMADSFNDNLSATKQIDSFNNKWYIGQATSITVHLPEPHVGQPPQETMAAYRALYTKLRSHNKKASLLFIGPAFLIPSTCKTTAKAAVNETWYAIQQGINTKHDKQVRVLDMSPYYKMHEISRLYRCATVPFYFNKLGVLRLISAIRENIPQFRATYTDQPGHA